jgi:tetratricopeptide (TPR) repeat protein
VGDITALKTAYSERRYADAWVIYRQLVEQGTAGPEAHLWGARAADVQGHLWAARTAADAALAAGPEPDLRCEALFTRGTVLQQVGEYRAAIEDLRASIAEVARHPGKAAVMLGPAWFNLGLCLRQSGRPAEAIGAYQQAIDMFRSEGLRTYLCMALQNLAWVFGLLGRRSEADEALAESAGLCATEYLGWHQRIGEAFATSLGEGEDQRLAMQLCESLVATPGDVPPDIRSHAYWVAGRVALRIGTADLAETLARQAVDWAARAKGANRSLADASELLRQVRLNMAKANAAGAS